MAKVGKIIVGTPEEGEDADCVVCALYDDVNLLMPDNLTGTCCKCGCGVQFRPSSPKKPPRMCWPCMMLECEKHEEEGDEDAFMISPKTMEEVAEYMKNKKVN